VRGRKSKPEKAKLVVGTFPGEIADQRLLFGPVVSKYFADADAGEVKWRTLTKLAP